MSAVANIGLVKRDVKGFLGRTASGEHVIPETALKAQKFPQLEI